jgi:hypothetical protein
MCASPALENAVKPFEGRGNGSPPDLVYCGDDNGGKRVQPLV